MVAGGTDIYPAARPGKGPAQYIDITRVSGLSGITRDGDGWRIGATVRWAEIAHAGLPPPFAALAAAAREVGSVQIQNAGTIAGNLCNASPAADGVPPLLVLDASVEIASAAGGTRVVPLQAFITGARQNDLQAGELVTAILLQQQPDGARSAFHKLGSRRYLVISIAMVAALVATDADGRIAVARIAVGACAPVALRLQALEQACIGQRPEDVRVLPEHLAPLSPISDVRGSADYRRDAVVEQIQRAIMAAAHDG